MVQTCAEMLNLDELEENDAETFSIYGNWGHNVAEIGAEGKIQHFIYNLLFTTTAATEYLNVLRSSRLNNKFYSNVVCKASIFSIKQISNFKTSFNKERDNMFLQ